MAAWATGLQLLAQEVQVPSYMKSFSSEQKWTDLTGKHAIEAKFSGYDPVSSLVYLHNGKGVKPIEFGKLSEADQKRVATQLKRLPADVGRLHNEYEDAFRKLRMETRLAQEELGRLRAANLKLEEELEKLRPFAPSKSLADKNGLVEIFQNDLEARGRELVGKTVRLVDCKYFDVSDLYDDDIPRELGCFSVWDRKGDSIDVLFNRKTLLEFVLSLEQGESLNIVGDVTVVSFGGMEYLIKASQVQKSPSQ